MNRVCWTAASGLLLLVGCRNDSSLTAIKSPEPPAFDTSEPPVEAEQEVAPEDLPVCGDPGIVPATIATVSEDCLIEPIQRTIRPVIEWTAGRTTAFPTFPDHNQTVVQPSVGHFTDDNGDGVIGTGDIPDVAAIFWDGGDFCRGTWGTHVLRLLSGDGTTEHWSVEGIPGEPDWDIGGPGSAIGDVDGDGLPEVVVASNPKYAELDSYPQEAIRLAVFNHDGSLEWVSEPRTDGDMLGCGRDTCIEQSVPTLVDINQDGVVEILLGTTIYDGRDGTPWEMPEDWGDTMIPIVVDLDKDGEHELITRYGIYEQDLTPRCTFGWRALYPAAADIDGDGLGEVVLTGWGSIEIFDSQCRLQEHNYLGDSGTGGPATIADYDGDGQPEIGVASAGYYFVYESDLSERWRAPVQDYTSNQTGSSVYDFDGDGYAEVVYAGEYNLWVYSGIDGTVRLQDSVQLSCTYIEYPMVVDVDGDDQVEIVVVDGNGMRVMGDRDNGWVPGRQVWNQHAYSIFNVNDDLTIPTYNPPNWPEYNSFRSSDQRLNNGDGANLVDALPMAVDICETECDRDTVQLTLRSANHGLADARDGVAWAIYAETADGGRTLLETVPAESVLRSGYASEGLTFRFDMADLPTGAVIVVADDDGTGVGVIEECDESNNELVLRDLCSGG